MKAITSFSLLIIMTWTPLSHISVYSAPLNDKVPEGRTYCCCFVCSPAVPCTQTRRVWQPDLTREDSNRASMTHNRLSPLFYSEFVIRITVILWVKVWFVNVSLSYTFCFSFTGITGLSFCFILFVLLFIWKKVKRKECELAMKSTFAWSPSSSKSSIM